MKKGTNTRTRMAMMAKPLLLLMALAMSLSLNPPAVQAENLAASSKQSYQCAVPTFRISVNAYNGATVGPYTVSSTCRREIWVRFAELPVQVTVQAIQCPSQGNWKGRMITFPANYKDRKLIANQMIPGTCFRLLIKNSNRSATPTVSGWVRY